MFLAKFFPVPCKSTVPSVPTVPNPLEPAWLLGFGWAHLSVFEGFPLCPLCPSCTTPPLHGSAMGLRGPWVQGKMKSLAFKASRAASSPVPGLGLGALHGTWVRVIYPVASPPGEWRVLPSAVLVEWLTSPGKPWTCRNWLHGGYMEHRKAKTPPRKAAQLLDFTWCPRSESNQRLMITSQLHDLHATGAPGEARIIALTLP